MATPNSVLKIKEIYREKIINNKKNINIHTISNKSSDISMPQMSDSKNNGLSIQTQTSLKQKIKEQIEKRFKNSRSNMTYEFPRISNDDSDNDSLESMKEIRFYDLREQNKNRLLIVKNSSLNENNDVNSPEKKKFISGKYQILKGHSLFNGREPNSMEILEKSDQENIKQKTKNLKNMKNIIHSGGDLLSNDYDKKEMETNHRKNIKNMTNSGDLMQILNLDTTNKETTKIQRHSKNYTGSGDLKKLTKKSPYSLNPLYLLTQNTLTFKKNNLKIVKGLSGNLDRIKKKSEMSLLKQFSNTFLEINSMKVSMPPLVKMTSNSFKLSSNSNKIGTKK